jgi:hypothetical protein
MPVTPVKAERRTYVSNNGKVHETINIARADDEYVWLSFYFDDLDNMEQTARDLLRLAAEWRQERA